MDGSEERNLHRALASIFRRKEVEIGRMLRSFGGKESRWGACFDLSAERNQDGAHASTFRRKGIKMGRMLRPFGGKESRWGACFDLSAKRNQHAGDPSIFRQCRRCKTLEYAIMPSCPALIGFSVRCVICEFRSPTGATSDVRIACHLTRVSGSTGVKFCLLKRLRGSLVSFLGLALRKSGSPAANRWFAKISIG